MEGLKIPRIYQQSFSCEVNALKMKNTVENDVDSVLEGYRNYNSALADNLLKLLPKPLNKYSIKVNKSVYVA